MTSSDRGRGGWVPVAAAAASVAGWLAFLAWLAWRT